MAIVNREVKIVPITNVTTFEEGYNTTHGKDGWRIVQVFERNDSMFALVEREVE